MNFTGKLEGLKMDYATKKQSISVEVNEDARDAFQELKDCEKLECLLLGINYEVC